VSQVTPLGNRRVGEVMFSPTNPVDSTSFPELPLPKSQSSSGRQCSQPIR